MKGVFKYIFIALIVNASLSCKRQQIFEPELFTVDVPIVIDWSESLVDESKINNVSVYFYHENGSAPIIAYSNDPHHIKASLYEGRYDIVLHNEIEGNILGVDCHGSHKD